MQITRPTPENHAKALKTIPEVPLPKTDPVLGPDGPLAPVRTVSEAPSAEPLSTRSATASLHAHIDHIEERIERLEKTVGAAVDLLHRLLHPDKVTKPATPGSQR